MPIDGNINPTNPAFWQNLAAEHIYGAAERRTASVDTLKTVIVWAFGIFSVGGFVSTLFGKLSDFDQNALIAFGIAFFLLTAAYYLAGRAQFPNVEKYKLGDPKTVVDSYSENVRSQSTLFSVASAITGLGFFFLASGLLVEFGTVKKNSQRIMSADFTVPFLKTGIEKRGDTTYIPTTINWQKSMPVTLDYIKVPPNKNSSGANDTFLFSQIMYTDSSGRLFHSLIVPNKDSVQRIIIKATFTEKETKDTLIQKVLTVKLSLSGKEK